MKTRFHLNKRPPSRSGFHATSSTGHGGEHAVALVDERYLGWLAGQRQTVQGSPVLQRPALMPVLSHLAQVCDASARLLRTCLFTDKAASELLDDVLVRTVPVHAADGGLGLVRAMGLELTQLAQRGACAWVLLASDDERLIPYIDEAQWRGLKVALLMDDSAQDFAKLQSEDPSWARLLLQADRRLTINDAAWLALTTAGAGYFASRPIEPASKAFPGEDSTVDQHMMNDDWQAHMERVIQEWWADETHQAKLDLYDEMQHSQGVPPDTDRHLLLRVRSELSRTLSFPEKKTMREMIRATVLAQAPVEDEAA